MVTATRTEHRGAGDDGAAAAAAAAAEVTGKTARSASGRRLTATAASRHGMVAKGRPGVPIRMLTTRRCRLGMAGGPPPDRPATLAGRKRRAAREASLPAPASRKTVNRAKQGVVAAAAAALMAAAAILAVPQRLPRAAGSRVVRVMRVPAAVDGTAGAQAMSADQRRPSIAGDATNSLRWRENAKKTTRAWNSSVSRMSATTAVAATTVIRRMMMTPSSRVVSTRCSTCRAGWRRSASSSPEISTPAADHPAGQTLAVVANRGPTPHHAAHPTGHLATRAVAAAQAMSADGIRFIRMAQPHASPTRERGNTRPATVRPPVFPCLRCGLG